jgi:hypothetical protein
MVSVGTKPSLVHVVEALTQEYCFRVTKSLPRAPLDSPQRLATYALAKLPWSPWCRLHYGASPPRKGVSTSPAQRVLTTPHQAWGSMTIAGEPLRPQGIGEPCTTWSTQEPLHKVGTTLHSLSSKLSLALSTYTKHMQVYGWAIKHFEGLDMIL